MTIIKRLTCKGFKSFAKKTEIPLLNGYNVVIGANGSGKSNISDALCFVLGKSSARGLRAEKSANLIYHGGKKGSPAKEAEVSVVFCNEKGIFPIEGEEVEITRIVSKKGTSKYLINGKQHTRQQILELLGHARINPDGHNIVLQGDVLRFTDMKTAERREIIEDIAGISIFEEKKGKAMNELNKVQDKLNEADIILTEREKTLKDLKKDRDQAVNYKSLEKDIGRNKATKNHLMFKEKAAKLEEVEKKFSGYELELIKINGDIEKFKEEKQGKRKRILEINHELNVKGNKRQRELSKEIEEIKTRIIKHSSRKDVLENELRKLKDRKKSLERDSLDLEKNVAKFRKEQEKLKAENEVLTKKEVEVEKKVADYKEKHDIKDKEDIGIDIEDLEKRLDSKQRQWNDAENKRNEYLREKDKITFKINDCKEKISKLGGANDGEVSKLKKNRDEFTQVTRKLSDALNENSIFSAQLGDSRSRLMEIGDEMAKLRARNISIREMNASSLGVQKIKSLNLSGVYGTVSELGEVPSKYSVALEVAAGPRLKSMVVSTDVVAAKCISELKRGKSGVVTFLPLNKLRERVVTKEVKSLLNKEGVLGFATDIIKFDSKFSKVFNYVFAGTLVVEDLGVARNLGIGSARMVTLEGDLVELSGAMVGGHRRKTGMGFKEKEVSSGLDKLESEYENLQKKVSMLEDKKSKNDMDIVSLRERKAVLEAEIKVAKVSTGDVEELQKIKSENEKLLKKVDNELENYLQDVEDIAIEIKKLQEERFKLREKLTTITSSSFNDDLEKMENERRTIKENVIKNTSDLNAMVNQIKLFEKERERALEILKRNEKEFEHFSKELNTLKEDYASSKEVLKLKEKTQREFYAEYQGMFKERTKFEKDINKLDGLLARNIERVRGVEGRKNEVSIKKAVLSGEVEGLKVEQDQYKDVQLRRGVALEVLNAEINNFEKMLRNMGNVNLRALEIYENVHEEYKKLLDKYEQLKLEKEDVLKLIYEIDSKKTETFMKTFNLLERNFKEIFAGLTKVGDAELVIENPDDVFSEGIDIRVKIAGSKYMDLKGLSGGERSLTALAFIFAIQEFEPSSFYLMDEVDAALDKRNSELLSKLIAKYAHGAQYFVISHNDSVISEADAIFGVSMQDGVSKVISLKV
jgi:chromosome segregation protein